MAIPLSIELDFLLKLLKMYGQKVEKDFPVLFRMSGDEFVEGGLTIEDTKVIARIIGDAGVDAIHVSQGVYKTMHYVIQPASVAHGFSVNLAPEIKSVVSIPVITVGRINDPLIAESVLQSGKADMVSMGRASLADPEPPNKTMAGKLDEILHCIGCMQGCVGRLIKGMDIQCVVNPLTGKEAELAIEEAEIKKKVFVIGGGISGMECVNCCSKKTA